MWQQVAVTLGFRRLRPADCKFKASLGYRGRCWFNATPQQQQLNANCLTVFHTLEVSIIE